MLIIQRMNTKKRGEKTKFHYISTRELNDSEDIDENSITANQIQLESKDDNTTLLFRQQRDFNSSVWISSLQS